MYSKEDLENMVSAYKQIEEYVEKHWRPRLLPNEQVNQCGFGFNDTNIWYDGAYFHYTPGCLNVYKSPASAVRLIFNWEEVKNAVERVLLDREDKKRRIREFHV